MGSLASLLRAQGRVTDAEPLYRSTLNGRREALGACGSDFVVAEKRHTNARVREQALLVRVACSNLLTVHPHLLRRGEAPGDARRGQQSGELPMGSGARGGRDDKPGPHHDLLCCSAAASARRSVLNAPELFLFFALSTAPRRGRSPKPSPGSGRRSRRSTEPWAPRTRRASAARATSRACCTRRAAWRRRRRCCGKCSRPTGPPPASTARSSCAPRTSWAPASRTRARWTRPRRSCAPRPAGSPVRAPFQLFYL